MNIWDAVVLLGLFALVGWAFWLTVKAGDEE